MHKPCLMVSTATNQPKAEVTEEEHDFSEVAVVFICNVSMIYNCFTFKNEET